MSWKCIVPSHRPPTPTPYLPDETVTAGRSLNIDGVRIDLMRFGPAHTSGDLVVWVPSAPGRFEVIYQELSKRK